MKGKSKDQQTIRQLKREIEILKYPTKRLKNYREQNINQCANCFYHQTDEDRLWYCTVLEDWIQVCESGVCDEHEEDYRGND